MSDSQSPLRRSAPEDAMPVDARHSRRRRRDVLLHPHHNFLAHIVCLGEIANVHRIRRQQSQQKRMNAQLWSYVRPFIIASGTGGEAPHQLLQFDNGGVAG